MLWLTTSFKLVKFIAIENYWVQFREPWFHSWKRPANKITIKINLVKDQERMLDAFKIIIIGKINAISTSKIKKIMAIKKNCIEKGIREVFRGSNPHSKGEDFSRSLILFFDKKEANLITTKEINKTIIAAMNKFKIIYTKIFSPYDWKSYIQSYTI